MESAREFAERYFAETSGACERLAKDAQARDAAIRAECADRAVRYVFFDGDDPEAFPNAPPISSTGLRAAIMGEEGR